MEREENERVERESPRAKYNRRMRAGLSYASARALGTAGAVIGGVYLANAIKNPKLEYIIGCGVAFGAAIASIPIALYFYGKGNELQKQIYEEELDNLTRDTDQLVNLRSRGGNFAEEGRGYLIGEIVDKIYQGRKGD